MFVGILKIEIFIPQSNSLKHKRMVLNSLFKRLRNKFNISICALDGRDKWQRSYIGIAYAIDTKRSADKVMAYVKNFIEREKNIQILDYNTELI